MRDRHASLALVGLLIFLACLYPSFAGDALYGKVVQVKSGEVITLEYGAGRYDIRLVGIYVLDEVTTEAAAFLSNLALGKNAGVRFESRTPTGELLSRVFVQDPLTRKMQDAGLELVSKGWARRQKDFDYKYGELSAAESEARKAHRGLWKNDQP